MQHSEHHRASRIAGRIDRDSCRPGDFAVLYRVNAQSQPIEDALRARGIPYRVRGSVAFFERAEIRDAMAYARILCDPETSSDADFERAIGAPHRGIGPATIDRLRAGRVPGGSLFAEARKLKDAGNSSKRGRAVAAFVDTISDLGMQAADGMYDAPVLGRALERTGYLDALRAAKDDEKERVANVEALLALEARHHRSGSSFRDFVDGCAVGDVPSSADADEDSVQLMTLHASKGLEFREVFIAGCVEGWMPYSRSVAEGRIEEERRLCYVGITRARDRLTLSAPSAMAGFRGDFRATCESRFISEAGL